MSKTVIDPAVFRDYDIRGTVPEQLNDEGIRYIAAAIVNVLKPSSVQIGHDMRVSSPELFAALKETFLNLGINVVDLGLISTDMLYFAAGKYNEDLALTISASHNPSEYNGIKLVKKGAVSIGKDSGLVDIKENALCLTELPTPVNRGELSSRNIMSEFIDHVFSFVDVPSLGSFKVVIDAGNGMAGHFLPYVEEKLNWQVERLYYELDGTFPHHQPSPIEEKNMQDVISKVKEVNADFGMAFDGDADRVFLVDETGKIISGTIMSAILSKLLLEKYPGENILYNAIIGRIVPEVIVENGGKGIRVKVGHTFIKENMRKHNAIFCGEHSGHYYFRENFYADSAIIPALLIAELMAKQQKTLSQLVSDYDKYFASGEINFLVDSKEEVIAKVESRLREQADSIDHLDGLSIWYKDWWFNLRPSNTEPYLRLNIEANNVNLLKEKQDYLLQLLKGLGGQLNR